MKSHSQPSRLSCLSLFSSGTRARVANTKRNPFFHFSTPFTLPTSRASAHVGLRILTPEQPNAICIPVQMECQRVFRCSSLESAPSGRDVPSTLWTSLQGPTRWRCSLPQTCRGLFSSRFFAVLKFELELFWVDVGSMKLRGWNNFKS